MVIGVIEAAGAQDGGVVALDPALAHRDVGPDREAHQGLCYWIYLIFCACYLVFFEQLKSLVVTDLLFVLGVDRIADRRGVAIARPGLTALVRHLARPHVAHVLDRQHSLDLPLRVDHGPDLDRGAPGKLVSRKLSSSICQVKLWGHLNLF